MKCAYCGVETDSKYCSKEHRIKHQDSIDNMLPKIGVRALDDKEKSMQQQFIKKMNKEEKRNKLKVSLGAI